MPYATLSPNSTSSEMGWTSSLGLVLALHFATGLLPAADTNSIPQKPQNDLTEQSLDELMRIEVKTSARKEQTISQTAAAIHVITQEDIRRSGATTIAEAL